MSILAAHDVYPVGQGAERVHHTFWPQYRPLEPMNLPPANRMASAKAAVSVTINHGRWVVVCPDCNEGQVADREDHRFLCIQCLNVKVDGAWRPVAWPKQAAAIEAELSKREDPLTRGWRPGETVEDLRTEVLNQYRPSVPRLEDLKPADQERLLAIHNDLDQPNPEVRWGDDARSKPEIIWTPSKRKKSRSRRVD